MARGKAAGSKRLRVDETDASSHPATYMLGLSEQVISMADAVLVVQAREVPVHTYILAANSPVLAALLETAQHSAGSTTPQQAKAPYRVPLEGHNLLVVCTALKYMYSGSYVVSPSQPAIQSCEDAAALVVFAHKYSMTPLLDTAEGHLVEAACKDQGKQMFNNPTQLVAWVTLAERCKLDVFLAHAEQFMIKLMDVSFWGNGLANGTGGISEQCFLRVLRGALHGRQQAITALEQTKQSASSATCCCCASRCPVPSQGVVDVDALDVSITTLIEWHGQDL